MFMLIQVYTYNMLDSYFLDHTNMSHNRGLYKLVTYSATTYSGYLFAIFLGIQTEIYISL